MDAIWKNDGAVWSLLPPAGFVSEAELHDLVERAPHMLPVSGAQRLVVVGREVPLGGNWADLIAIEPSGRLAIVEIKLGKNAEARRAVVAQVLTYASFLHSLRRDDVEAILRPHLEQRGYASLADAVAANDQEGAFEPASFSAGLERCLTEGGFRLVIVLDEAPPALVRLAGYLAAIGDKATIDLMTVTSYAVGGEKLVVPRRVSLERPPREPDSVVSSEAAGSAGVSKGADVFASSIDTAALDLRGQLQRLLAWANTLEAQGLAVLLSNVGKSGRVMLLPHIPGENVGLVTLWNADGAYLSFWRSVFERLAPRSLARIEAMPDAPKVGQGTYPAVISDALLEELTGAYREAVGRAPAAPNPNSGQP